MELFRSIKEDIQMHRNIEYYITLLIAVPIAILGIFGNVSANAVSSGTLAVLALVTFGLLQNRHENENILKVISTTQKMDAKIDEILHDMGRKFHFTKVDGNYELAKRTIRDLVEQATKEVLILDYNPPQKIASMLRNSPQDIMSDERQKYYDVLLEKSAMSKPGQFRYRRILQLPDGYQIADVLSGDTILKLHCNELLKISAKNPADASLKACPTIHEGAFFLIDGRYLIVDLNILDPENRFYVGAGHFIFDDPTGELIATFRRFFDRADSYAVPVRTADMP